MTHGHAPRVRQRQEEQEQQAQIVIHTEPLINRVIDASLTAGVSLAIAQLLDE